ncbi:MAG: hypothetical protein ACXW4B_11470 [Micavibrio sp.]
MIRPGGIFIIAMLMAFLLPVPVRGAENATVDCVAAYEKAAAPYRMITGDIMKFKAMYDDYDRLCRLHYPDDIAALQPIADDLRNQTDRDLENTHSAMAMIFDDALPKMVPAQCAADDTARNKVKKKFLTAMDEKAKTLDLRMKKSAKSLQQPKDKLTLCTQLQPLKKKVEKALGPGLANPLLEMSVMSRTLARGEKHNKKALKTYRETVKFLTAE